MLGDSLAPMTALWTEIIETPADAAHRYRTIWTGQRADDAGYFNAIRARFNALRDPVDLLYLLCRCVKIPDVSRPGRGVGLDDAGTVTPQEPECPVGLRALGPAVRGPYGERVCLTQPLQ